LPEDWDVFDSRVAAIYTAHEQFVEIVAAGVNKALVAAFGKDS